MVQYMKLGKIMHCLSVSSLCCVEMFVSADTVQVWIIVRCVHLHSYRQTCTVRVRACVLHELYCAPDWRGEGGVAPIYPCCTTANVASNTVSTLFVSLVKVSPWLGHLDSTGLSFTLAWALGLYWAFKLGSLKGSMIRLLIGCPLKWQ